MKASMFYGPLLAGVCIGTFAGRAVGEQGLKRSARTLEDALPYQAARLFEWPTEAVVCGPRRVRGDEDPRVARAKKSSVRWIKKVLNPQWLPDGETWLEDNLMMIRGEFAPATAGESRPFDSIRVQWERDGYKIQVSQTLDVITIKVTPPGPTGTGANADQRRTYAAELCSRLINNTGTRWGQNDRREPVEVPVEGVGDRIREGSFRPETTRQFSDGAVAGDCSPPDDEAMASPRDQRGANADDRMNNPYWDKTGASWGYWWRHVCWWHDGRQVGFFTLKNEGGPRQLDYWSPGVGTWFKPVPFQPAHLVTTRTAGPTTGSAAE